MGVGRDYKTMVSAIYGRGGKGQRKAAIATHVRAAGPPVVAGQLLQRPLGRGAESLARRAGASEKQAQGAKVLGQLSATVPAGLYGAKRSAAALRQGGYAKAFANRDENSSIGTQISWKGPQGPHQKPTLRAVARGTEQGYGGQPQRASRDENSSVGVTWLQPRRPDGKFASKEPGFEVFRPRYKTSSRMPRQSTLQHATKEGDSAARAFVGKAMKPVGQKLKPWRFHGEEATNYRNMRTKIQSGNGQGERTGMQMARNRQGTPVPGTPEIDAGWMAGYQARGLKSRGVSKAQGADGQFVAPIEPGFGRELLRNEGRKGVNFAKKRDADDDKARYTRRAGIIGGVGGGLVAGGAGHYAGQAAWDMGQLSGSGISRRAAGRIAGGAATVPGSLKGAVIGASGGFGIDAIRAHGRKKRRNAQ